VVKNRNIELNKAFGDHLRKLRLDQNLSQEDLANLTDVPISQIGRIERGEGNPTISTLYLLSKALKIDLKDLLSFDFTK